MTEMTWFVRDKDRVRGPFSQDQLVKQHRRGVLARFHDISTDRKSWVKAATVLDQFAGPPPPPTPGPVPSWSAAPRESPSQSSTEQSWPGVSDEYQVNSTRSARPSRRAWWPLLLVVPCLLLASGLTYLAIRNSRTALPPMLGGGPTIQSLNEEDKLTQAVGLVVVGIEQTMPDGTHGDIRISTGSCFAVSPEGHLITNRHVVEFHDQITHAAGLANKKLVYLKSILEDNRRFNEELEKEVLKAAPEKRNEVRDRIYQNVAESTMKQSDFTPKLWVFFLNKSGRPEKYDAKIVHLCDKTEPDIAILKITPKDGSQPLAFFRVSDEEKATKTGDPVVAIGYPGTARMAVSDSEKLEEKLRLSQATRVESMFKERDFGYVRTKGDVTQMFWDRASGCRWIQHDAVITHGNSGGPLLNKFCTIIGVNTQGISDGATYQAISAVQLKPIIESCTTSAVFDSR